MSGAGHLHGFFFQVVAVDGVRTTPTSWEDTVNVTGKQTVTIAFRPDDRRSRSRASATRLRCG